MTLINTILFNSLFIILFFVNPTLSQDTTIHKYSPFDSVETRHKKLIFKLNFIKEILSCIAKEDGPEYSEKLINYAKNTKNINEDFDMWSIERYSFNVYDKQLINRCKKENYFNADFPGEENIKPETNKSIIVNEENILKRKNMFKVYRALRNKRRKGHL